MIEKKTTADIVEDVEKFLDVELHDVHWLADSKESVYMNEVWVRLDKLKERWDEAMNCYLHRTPLFTAIEKFERDVFGDAEETKIKKDDKTLSERSSGVTKNTDKVYVIERRDSVVSDNQFVSSAPKKQKVKK